MLFRRVMAIQWRQTLFLVPILFCSLLSCSGTGGEGATPSVSPTADTTSPAVVAVFPRKDATGVSLTPAVTATFSKVMDASSLTATTFTVRDAQGNLVPGTISHAGTSVTFVPSVALAPSSSYLATITAGVIDLARNALPSDYFWPFATGTVPDTTPPTVIATTPANGATGVAVNTTVTAMFSEVMDASSINTTTFTVKDGNGNPVTGTVTYVGATATFTPSLTLVSAASYTGAITTGVRDLSGNTLLSDYIWTFQTGVKPVSFAVYDSFLIAESASSIEAVDLKSDGKLDLLVTDSRSNLLSVWLGNGTGSFGQRTDFAVGEAPSSIAVSDFNVDGRRDVAVVNGPFRFPIPSGTVSVLLGDGTGAFSAATNYTVGLNPLDLVAADFTDDGIPDIATTNRFSNNVSVLIGTGMGGFSAATNFFAGFSPWPIATGDFNKDGKLDLAVGGDSSIQIMLGTGGGSFSFPVSFNSAYTTSLATADLDGDGNLDLVGANDGTDHVTVLMGNGTGAFDSPRSVLVGRFPRTVSIADLNKDGFHDLVVTTQFNGGLGSNTVYVVLGTGGGQFGQPTAVYFTAVQYGIVLPFAAVGDFNGDERPDLAIVDPSSDIGPNAIKPRTVILLNTTP